MAPRYVYLGTALSISLPLSPWECQEEKSVGPSQNYAQGLADGMGIIPHDMVFILDTVQEIVSGYKNKLN